MRIRKRKFRQATGNRTPRRRAGRQPLRRGTHTAVAAGSILCSYRQESPVTGRTGFDHPVDVDRPVMPILPQIPPLQVRRISRRS